MTKLMSFDDLMIKLKETSDENREIIEIEEDVANIIHCITKARIEQKMTQEQLAHLCGLKQSAIARMENLQVVPRLDTVIKIARKLGVRLSVSSVQVFAPTVVYNPVLCNSTEYNWKGATVNDFKTHLVAVQL